jgi:hypothetical protein
VAWPIFFDMWLMVWSQDHPHAANQTRNWCKRASVDVRYLFKQPLASLTDWLSQSGRIFLVYGGFSWTQYSILHPHTCIKPNK